MAKPTNNATGVITIPEADFLLWVQTNYLKPQPGTFVTWGKVKIKTDTIEAAYTTSTQDQPAPPPEAATTPV